MSAWESYFSRQASQCPIGTNTEQLDFGSCSRLSPANHQTLTVTNTTASKVTAFLLVPAWQGPGLQSQPQQVFQVCLPELSNGFEALRLRIDVTLSNTAEQQRLQPACWRLLGKAQACSLKHRYVHCRSLAFLVNRSYVSQQHTSVH